MARDIIILSGAVLSLRGKFRLAGGWRAVGKTTLVAVRMLIGAYYII